MVLNTQMTQQVIEKLQQLAPQQVASVMAFIDVLIDKQLPTHPTTPPTGLPPEHNTGVGIGLLEVRKRLAKIPGKLSDTVRELRDERG